jgi:hypothetical protein
MPGETLFDRPVDTPELDLQIYRVFKLWQLEEALRLRCLWLYPPRNWDDPFESLLERCHLESDYSGLPMARAYVQCWSATGESDTLSGARTKRRSAQGLLVRCLKTAPAVEISILMLRGTRPEGSGSAGR